MSKTEKRQRMSLKPLQTEGEGEEAAYAMLGREFVRLIRDHENPAVAERAAALKLAEWLYEHGLTKAERRNFIARTGWLFECELPADDPLLLLPESGLPSSGLADPETPF